MTITVSLGHSADVPSIMPVMASAFDPAFAEAWSEDQCRGALTMPGTNLLIARQDEAVIGFALMRSLLEETELFLIGIDKRQQGQGLGKALMDHVFDHARSLGASMLFVEVRQDNPALIFYDHLGFAKIGERPNYYRRKDNGPSAAYTLSINLNNH